MKKNKMNYGDVVFPLLTKLWRVMKITCLFLMLAMVQVSASTYAQNARLTLNKESTSLATIFEEIEKNSEFRFFYDSKQIDLTAEVTVKAKNSHIEVILEQMFDNSDISYEIIDRHIILKNKRISDTEEIFFSNQQQNSISGKVTDTTGQPLPGVTIVVKGTTQGTVTESDGKYSVSNVSPSTTLIFSFVGMKSQEVVVGNQTSVNVTMEEETIGLDEVVAIGYGTLRKKDLTGSVKRVSLEDKSVQGNVNLLQSLSGVAAGVNVVSTGYAGGEPGLTIRGKTSLSASDAPLIVIDGIIFNGSLNNLNMNDIETVDILKDASAAAVYGSRSANGVMLISTKKGASEKPTVSFNMYYGYQDMTNNPMKVMNAEQYAIRLVDYYYQQDLYNWYSSLPTGPEGKPIRPDVTNRETVAMRLRTQEERDNYLAGKEIDWVKEVQQLASIQNYSLNFSGKNAKSSYYISGSYTDEQGILKNDQFNRLTFNANLESEITNWLTLGMNSSYAYLDYSGFAASLNDARVASPLGNNYIGSPNYDMYVTGEFYMPYPLNNLYIDNDDIRKNLLLLGRAKITVPWIKGLSNELNYSYNYSNRNNFTFFPVTVPDGSNNKGQAEKEPTEENNWIVNNIIAYSRDFNNHFLNGTLLLSREHRNFQSSWLNSEGFDNPVLGYNNMGLGTQARVGSSAWEENSIAYMARLNYAYTRKYLITATFRRDGFSGFSENRKFANFPALSLGWVISEEAFLNNQKDLYLKLRTSYGENGNQGIGRYSSFSRMGNSAYAFDSNTAIAVFSSTLGNKDLGWETTTSFNIGLDYKILNQKISGSVDVYKAKTTDVLVSRALPRATGYESVWSNIGGIENKGIEIELNTINLDGRLVWKSDFVFSLNRDKISKLYGKGNDKDIGNSWFVGEPIGAIYDYEMQGGVWSEKDLYEGKIYEGWYPGQFKYVDQNNDNLIDPNNDRKIIGYSTPSYWFSINNTLTYKNFIFSFFINSIQGGENYYLADNASVLNVSWRSDDVIRINGSAVRPYWTPDNGVNNATGIYNSPPVTSGIYQSRSFIRLQNISLGYKLGDKLTKAFKLESCQFFIASKNPYIWTKWSGWDPEIENGNTPSMRNVTIGANITL